MAALRTFVAAVDAGGFGKAAERLNRTPGAVSLQMKTLEDRLAQSLFDRAGRRSRLTPAGETLLRHARRVLAANDEAVLALTALQASGEIRFGMPQDLADAWLAPALGRFSRAYPAIRLEIQIGRSTELSTALGDGSLDVAAVFQDASDETGAASLFEVHWWGATNLAPALDEPMPLLLLDAPCRFRDAAIKALDEAGILWRVALTSASVSALWSAAAAGLGVTARTGVSVPEGVARIDHPRFPPLRPVELAILHRLEPAAARLADVVRETVRNRG